MYIRYIHTLTEHPLIIVVDVSEWRFRQEVWTNTPLLFSSRALGSPVFSMKSSVSASPRMRMGVAMVREGLGLLLLFRCCP